MRLRPWLPISLGLALALSTAIAATTRAAWAQAPKVRSSQSPAQPTATAAQLRLRGLPNLGIVNPHLYRGGQPSDTGFAELKGLGVDIVVNLRHGSGHIADERTLVNAQGMRYVSIPWEGGQTPSTEQVAEFLTLLRDNPGHTVFVHCRRGAERTGVFVACYRMAREGWTPEQALAEMELFRFRGLRFGHLKRFVRAFPTLLLRDPFTGPDDLPSRKQQ